MSAFTSLSAADEEISRLRAHIVTLKEQIAKDDAERLERERRILTPARRALIRVSYQLTEAMATNDPECVEVATKALIAAAVVCGQREEPEMATEAATP